MDKVFPRIGAAFLAIGLVGLAGCGYWAVRTRAFLARAERAPGTVVDLEPSRSKDGTTYRPVVDYVLPTGQARTLRSNTGSNPPAFSIGEAVVVLYDPADPADARIDSTFSLWGGPIILGGMSALFGMIGGVILIARRVSSRRAQELRRRGTPVVARLDGVERNTSLRVNGRSPWRLVAQWQDPGTGMIHLFHSENIWFDPTPHVVQQELTVYVDRRNPKRYWVDVSFLPKLAA
jgi:hypothetical protein